MGDGLMCHYCRRYNCLCHDSNTNPILPATGASSAVGEQGLASQKLPTVLDHKFVANECHDHGCHFLFLQNGSKCAKCPAAQPGAEQLIEIIIRDIAELPDRSSPDDWPEAMLVTAEELKLIIERNLPAYAAHVTKGLQAAGSGPVGQEAGGARHWKFPDDVALPVAQRITFASQNLMIAANPEDEDLPWAVILEDRREMYDVAEISFSGNARGKTDWSADNYWYPRMWIEVSGVLTIEGRKARIESVSTKGLQAAGSGERDERRER